MTRPQEAAGTARGPWGAGKKRTLYSSLMRCSRVCSASAMAGVERARSRRAAACVGAATPSPHWVSSPPPGTARLEEARCWPVARRCSTRMLSPRWRCAISWGAARPRSLSHHGAVWAVQVARTTFYYGFIPLIILMGMRTQPRPTLAQLYWRGFARSADGDRPVTRGCPFPPRAAGSSPCDGQRHAERMYHRPARSRCQDGLCMSPAHLGKWRRAACAHEEGDGQPSAGNRSPAGGGFES